MSIRPLRSFALFCRSESPSTGRGRLRVSGTGIRGEHVPLDPPTAHFDVPGDPCRWVNPTDDTRTPPRPDERLGRRQVRGTGKGTDLSESHPWSTTTDVKSPIGSRTRPPSSPTRHPQTQTRHPQTQSHHPGIATVRQTRLCVVCDGTGVEGWVGVRKDLHPFCWSTQR